MLYFVSCISSCILFGCWNGPLVTRQVYCTPGRPRTAIEKSLNLKPVSKARKVIKVEANVPNQQIPLLEKVYGFLGFGLLGFEVSWFLGVWFVDFRFLGFLVSQLLGFKGSRFRSFLVAKLPKFTKCQFHVFRKILISKKSYDASL